MNGKCDLTAARKVLDNEDRLGDVWSKKASDDYETVDTDDERDLISSEHRERATAWIRADNQSLT